MSDPRQDAEAFLKQGSFDKVGLLTALIEKHRKEAAEEANQQWYASEKDEELRHSKGKVIRSVKLPASVADVKAEIGK